MDILRTKQEVVGNGRQTIKYINIKALYTCMNDDPYQTDKNSTVY